MKTSVKRNLSGGGFALPMTLILCAVAAVTLSAALQWASTSANNVERNNEYYRAVAAADGATERIVSRIYRDYWNGSESRVYNNLADYRTDMPSVADDSALADFSFSNGAGEANRVYVTRRSATTNRLTTSGLQELTAEYRVVANATTSKGVRAGVGQDVRVGTEPVFQFAIFYTMDLEINPGPNMTIFGRVHSNRDIYTRPNATNFFLSDVTAAGNINFFRKTGDQNGNSTSSVVLFSAAHEAEAGAKSMPVGTNNTSDAVHAILEIPPGDESPNSLMGRERYYNKADLIVVISASNEIVVKSGVTVNNMATTVSNKDWSVFMKTNGSFYNGREAVTIKPVDIDVAALREWGKTNNVVRSALGNRSVNSIYINDQRDLTNRTAVPNTNITTLTTYTTNAGVEVVSTNMPAAGTYVGTVQESTMLTNALTRPSTPPAINLVTNTTVTNSVSYPGAGTYVGAVTTNMSSTTVATLGAVPGGATILSTNTTMTNTVAYPGNGTYVGVVATNFGSATVATLGAVPGGAVILSTNTVATNTAAYPAGGTFIGTVTTNYANVTSVTAPVVPPARNVTTNTVSTNTVAAPSAGNYVGTLTTNCSATWQLNKSSLPNPYCGTAVVTNVNRWNYRTIASYSYNAIVNYSYQMTNGYGYTKITGYTYQTASSYQYAKITSYTYQSVSNYSYAKITGYTYRVPVYIYAPAVVTSTLSYLTNIYYTTNLTITTQIGVRLTNGAALPVGGLTVATPSPIYIQGHYNVASNSTATPTTGVITNTVNTQPASVVGDAVTLLSANWNDASNATTNQSVAGHTTFNTAIIAGIVETTIDTKYSGGVENFPRFLEKWDNITNTYNGSMVVMFESRIARAPWSRNGSTPWYTAPKRNWAFDLNFLNSLKLPPGTPQVVKRYPQKWAILAPNSTSF